MPKEIKEKRLIIKYSGKPDKKLEKAIEKLAKDFKWSWEGHGYDFVKDETDICFYKKGRPKNKELKK